LGGGTFRMNFNAVKSSLEFVDYRITNFEYKVSLENNENIDYLITIEPKIGKLEKASRNDDEKNFARIDLKLQLKGKAGRKVPLKINCSISGIFTADKTLTDEKFVHLCSTSGVANLLMIVRSLIISFTSQSGNKPIIMPLINLIETYRKKTKPQER
jgi:preprotein translocase subunit SecB